MRILIPIIGAVTLTGLCWFCVRTCVPAIESDLEARTTKALAATEYRSVQTEAVGLDVRLAGTVSSAAARDRAYAVAENVDGVRQVLRAITVTSSSTPAAVDSAGTGDPADDAAVAMSASQPADDSSSPDATGGDSPVSAGSSGSAGQATAPGSSASGASTVAAKPERASGTRAPAMDTPGAGSTIPMPKTGSAEQIKACQREIDNLIQTRRIQFVTASAGITESSMPLLDGLREVLIRYPHAHLEIAGHTDSRGIEDLNLRLSQARAEAVRSYLVQRGIDPQRLVAVGFGASHPIALNDTEEGRSMNRRIEFYVRGAQP
jgi:outer membrane protein OmpA-like peptidoglycan-associated protein